MHIQMMDLPTASHILGSHFPNTDDSLETGEADTRPMPSCRAAAIANAEPCDADVIYTAAAAVAKKHGMPIDTAITRLSAVELWVVPSTN